MAARIRSRRDPGESPTSGVHVPSYKYSAKLCAVYPEPLCWRRVLAEQTRPTPLGKHSIFYLNVKHGSCSLDAQPPAAPGRADGWHRAPTAVPGLAAAGAGRRARGGEGAAWLSAALTSAFLQVLLSQQWRHGAGSGRQHPLPPWGPQPAARAHGPSWPLPPLPFKRMGTVSRWHCDSAPSRKTKGGPRRVPRPRGCHCPQPAPARKVDPKVRGRGSAASSPAGASSVLSPHHAPCWDPPGEGTSGTPGTKQSLGTANIPPPQINFLPIMMSPAQGPHPGSIPSTSSITGPSPSLPPPPDPLTPSQLQHGHWGRIWPGGRGFSWVSPRCPRPQLAVTPRHGGWHREAAAAVPPSPRGLSGAGAAGGRSRGDATGSWHGDTRGATWLGPLGDKGSVPVPYAARHLPQTGAKAKGAADERNLK